MAIGVLWSFILYIMGFTICDWSSYLEPRDKKCDWFTGIKSQLCINSSLVYITVLNLYTWKALKKALCGSVFLLWCEIIKQVNYKYLVLLDLEIWDVLPFPIFYGICLLDSGFNTPRRIPLLKCNRCFQFSAFISVGLYKKHYHRQDINVIMLKTQAVKGSPRTSQVWRKFTVTAELVSYWCAESRWFASVRKKRWEIIQSLKTCIVSSSVCFTNYKIGPRLFPVRVFANTKQWQEIKVFPSNLFPVKVFVGLYFNHVAQI